MDLVGDGTRMKVWFGKWIKDKHQKAPIPKQSMINLNIDVAALMTHEIYWHPNKVDDLFL